MCRRKLVPVTWPTCLLCRTQGRDRDGFAAGRGCGDPEHRRYRVHAAVQMVEPADWIVHALKFHDRPDVGPSMALLLARRLRLAGARDWDLLVPMPLHATRERARGYNQSVEIAGPLGRLLGIPLKDRILVRARFTRPQADLDHPERAGNVEGAFRLSSGRGRRVASREAPGDGIRDRRSGSIEGLRCLVVDDVATTGHTLIQALDVLAGGGPAGMGAAVFALA